MPTAFDRHIPANDYNPLQNLLQFSGELDSTAENVGDIIRGYMQSLLQGVVEIIKDLTGLDLTEIATAIESIDFSSPQAFAQSLIVALFEIGGFVITLLESPDFYTGLLDKVGQDFGLDFSSPEALVNSFLGALQNFFGIDLIAMAEGDPQAIIDAILSLFGFPAGAGVPGDITQVFTDIMALLGNPLGVGVGAVDPLAWATTFINDILTPTGLLGGSASITALVDAILGSAGFPPGSGSVPNVAQYFTDLEALLSFPAGMATGTIDPVAWATAFITDILTPTGLIGGASELANLLTMLGLPDTASLASYLTALPPWAIPVIPASHVRNINPELLLNPGFDTATSITNTGPAIVWDGTTGHTANGSAKITPQGTSAIDALSNPIGVTAGEKLTVSVWAKWAGLTTSGSSPAPIRLDIAQYFKGALVSAVTAAAIASPGASSGWTQLQGAYTVPAGVDTVYHRPTVDTTATAGNVWFDDGSAVKAGALAAGTGLTDAFQATLTQLFGSNALAAAILPGIVPIIDASKILGGTFSTSLIPPLPPSIINGIMAIGQIPTNLLGAGNIADLQKTWDAVAGAGAGLGTLGAIGTRLTNLNTAGLFNAAQLFNIGNIPPIGQTSITGLPAALANLLSTATWQTFLDNATHGLGGPTSGNTIASYVSALGAIPRTNVAGLPGFLTNLSASGLLSGPGAVAGLTGYLANLNSSGLLNGPGAVAGLAGYLTNLSSAGLLNAAGISGTLPIGQIPTNQLGLGNIGDLQSLNDAITNAFQGVTNLIGTTIPGAAAAMSGITNTIVQNSQAVQALQTSGTANANSGQNYAVSFAPYPNGALPPMFTPTYSGPGASTIGISGGQAVMNMVPGADRAVFCLYNAGVTNTDYQLLGATISGAMGYSGGASASNYLYGRVKDANNYVYARYYTNGALQFYAELGAVVAGVKTVFGTNIPLPISTTQWLYCGTVAGANVFQLMSGSSVVYSKTDTAGISQIGAGFRGWSWGAATANNGAAAPAAGVAVSCADNQPPSFVGSGFRIHRAASGGVGAWPDGAAAPGSFFDTIDAVTADWVINLAAGTAQAVNAGWYTFTARVRNTTTNTSPISLLLFRNGANPIYGPPAANPITNSPGGYGATWTGIYLAAGDTIGVGQAGGGSLGNFNGDTAGQLTYLTGALQNRSLA